MLNPNIIERIFAAPPAQDLGQQAVSLRIAAALLHYAPGKKPACVLHAPRGIVLANNFIQPDILFISPERSGIVGKACLLGAPDLVVDIMPPGNHERNLRIRKRLYEFFTIPEYWIAHPHASTIDVLVWSEMGYLLTGRYASKDRFFSPLLPGLRLPLRKIFE